MEYEREALVQRLLRARGNGMVKIITGVRRCGKSYLLEKLFQRALLAEGVREEQIVFLALDDRRHLALRQPDALLAELESRLQTPGEHYILLDEVQMVGEFTYVLNSLLHRDGVEIYVTGSNSRFLSRDVVTAFRGRGDEIHIFPLSYAEVMQHSPLSKEEGLQMYLTYGGLPTVVQTDDEESKMRYLSGIFADTYLRDIRERFRLQSGEGMDELVDVIASGIGGLTNPQKLENTFRSAGRSSISAATITRYLGMLEDAFLLEKAQRYDIRGKRYISTPVKYYFTDPGLRNARLHFRQTEGTHLLENVIYNELRRRGLSVDVGVVPEQQKNPDGQRVRRQLEVDFVCNLGSRRCYIQSAYRMPTAEKREQELRSLMKIEDAFGKVVITADPVPLHCDEQGVRIMNIYDFLLHKAELPL